VGDRLSSADLATLSLLDPDQGTCPNGHGCDMGPEVGERHCRGGDYRGLALICWEITSGAIDAAATAGADPAAVAWARSFLESGVA
jgi:hypothetical protein